MLPTGVSILNPLGSNIECVKVINSILNGFKSTVPFKSTIFKLLPISIRFSLNFSLIKTAVNGVDALVKIGSMRPCVLITDLQMPQLDGFAILDRLQNNEQYDFIKPIVITGMSDDEINARGLPEGIPLLHKPIPVEELKSLIAQAIH